MAVKIKPFFIPEKEVNLFDAMNEELIDEIINQYVDVYKVSTEDTQENIYGESDKKYFKIGFRVNCLISFETTTDIKDFGIDNDVSAEIYFHRTSLSEANFMPEIGDVIDWNKHYFEINTIAEPQLIGGSTDFSHEIKVLAHRVRLSNLQIAERPR